ncbi:MAG: DUF115 domain-containing protein [Leptospiraceae bacterium]|nr:DUF115 domain-containing protein [Leptospiraceae bacterium]
MTPDAALLLSQLEMLALQDDPQLSAVATLLDSIETSRDGQATTQQNDIWLHSRHAVQKETDRQLESLDLHSPDQVLVCIGAGLGHLIQRCLQQTGNSIIWIEIDLELLVKALGVHDFRSALTSGRLQIWHQGRISAANCLDAKEQLLDDCLNNVFKNRSNSDVRFYQHRASFRARPEYQRIAIQLSEWLNRKSVNQATLERFDRLWTHNLLRNLPALIQARPVRGLFDQFRGCEVILVGAGPSLADDCERIHALRKGRLLICVDTALHILIKRDLIPDIVVAVDPQGVNQYYLEAITRASMARIGAWLIDPCVNYHCLRHIPPERLFFFESPFRLFQTIKSAFQLEAGQLAYGGSVSTNCWDLALKLGARSILLFGQDLAFTRERAHSPGATLEERLSYQEHRFQRREQHNYHQLYALPRRTVPDLQGEATVCNDKLIIFQQWFQKQIPLALERGVQVFDLKASGARLMKTRSGDGPPEHPATKVPFSGKEWPEPSLSVDALAAFIRPNLAGLAQVEFVCAEARTLAAQNQAYLQSIQTGRQLNESYFQRLRDLNRCDAELRLEQDRIQIAGEMIQKTINAITAEAGTLPVNAEGDDGLEQHRINAASSVRLYTDLGLAFGELSRWLCRLEIQLNRTTPSANQAYCYYC